MHERAPVSVPGTSDLVAWFGYWPSFHDAEVLSIHLNRSGESTIAIQTWHRTNEVDDHGYFIATKHVLVTFILEGIQTVRLDDFNHQNIISGLNLEETAAGCRLTLHPCFGAQGTIEAEHVRITHQPGSPLSSGTRDRIRS
jgi:immunity protein 50 of polymorphic toxin system